MNRILYSSLLLIFFALLFMAGLVFLAGLVFSQTYIAGHLVAKETILRSIPESYINKARTELVVAYQHTSHGTHVSRGVAGLQDYKSGDEVLFGVSGSPDAAKLEFRDFALEDYAPPGVDAADIPFPTKISCATCHGNHESLEDGITAPLRTVAAITAISLSHIARKKPINKWR